MTAITVRRYQPADKDMWNGFVARSKNGTFLFDRAFMDYHADRFDDHSLLIFMDGALRSVIAANQVGNRIISHGGLSYGGLLLEKDVHLAEVLSFFFHGLKYLHDNNISTLTYKCIPSYLAEAPSFEDQYALFLVDAALVRRDMSAVCLRDQRPLFRETRKQTIKKTTEKGYRVLRVGSVKEFWNVLENNLMEHHGVRPVHALNEMQLLMDRFPNQIHCFEVHGHDLLGGTIIFETATTAHTQYISATPEGRKSGALDFLFHVLITDTFSSKPYFSFGMSNEQEGRVLNAGLNSWKEGFGARVFPLDFYEVATAHYSLLGSYA